jgi:hypothetical protein
MGSKIRGQSTLVTKEENHRCLEAFISSTPVTELPRNQFGKVARSRILKILGIPVSTGSTNLGIKKSFDALDVIVVNQKPASREPLSRNSMTLIARDELQLLYEELDALRVRVSTLAYLENTGTDIL